MSIPWKNIVIKLALRKLSVVMFTDRIDLKMQGASLWASLAK
jgi:hypothetical protein